MNTWVTRDIKESKIIGGEMKKCYEIGPDLTITGSEPYKQQGGSPWGTSNVMAKVMGITKVSNCVYPFERSADNECAKLTTKVEECKAMGIVDIKVLAAGSIFLGQMIEPIKSTSNPYQKMNMGVPFTKRPKAVQFDYMLEIPSNSQMIYQNGVGAAKNIRGRDYAEVYVLLQRRVEDADGNIRAYRVGTGRELFGSDTGEWVNGHKTPIYYGDITGTPAFKAGMGLISAENSYYARNSKGKMVPVREVGWDSADAKPTHIILMFSSGSGEPYTGTPGQTFYVDNVAMAY